MADQKTFKTMLGNRQLGTLTFMVNGDITKLLSTLDNTPLGVADGSFEAVTEMAGGQVNYRGESQGSRTRTIEITRNANAVTAVKVSPESEKTGLSIIANVPSGVISPTEAFARMLTQGTCPSPMVVYDGRRVVQIGTTAMTEDAGWVECDLSYSVLLGPGHLSPFRFRSIDMSMTYAAGELARITVSAGGFGVTLIRQ